MSAMLDELLCSSFNVYASDRNLEAVNLEEYMIITIIIPCFNEDRSIRKVIESVLAADTLDMTKDIIVIDDGSTDDSWNEIQKSGNSIRAIRISKNMGKGNAIKEGMKFADGDIVLIQDADFEYSPSDYPQLLRPYLTRRDVFVMGVRTIDHHRPLLERINVFSIGGRLINLIAAKMFGYRFIDIHTCYKVFTKDLFNRLQISSNGFNFCHELTIKAFLANINFIEVPISYSPRGKNEGKKITITDGLICFFTLIRLFYEYRLNQFSEFLVNPFKRAKNEDHSA